MAFLEQFSYFLTIHIIKKRKEQYNSARVVVHETPLAVALVGLRALVTVSVALIVIFIFLRAKFYTALILHSQEKYRMRNLCFCATRKV